MASGRASARERAEDTPPKRAKTSHNGASSSFPPAAGPSSVQAPTSPSPPAAAEEADPTVASAPPAVGSSTRSSSRRKQTPTGNGRRPPDLKLSPPAPSQSTATAGTEAWALLGSLPAPSKSSASSKKRPSILDSPSTRALDSPSELERVAADPFVQYTRAQQSPPLGGSAMDPAWVLTDGYDSDAMSARGSDRFDSPAPQAKVAMAPSHSSSGLAREVLLSGVDHLRDDSEISGSSASSSRAPSPPVEVPPPRPAHETRPSQSELAQAENGSTTRLRREPPKRDTSHYVKDVSPTANVTVPAGYRPPSIATRGTKLPKRAAPGTSPNYAHGPLKEGAAKVTCSNCGTDSSPLFRRDSEGLYICNACGLYLKSHGHHRPMKVVQRKIGTNRIAKRRAMMMGGAVSNTNSPLGRQTVVANAGASTSGTSGSPSEEGGGETPSVSPPLEAGFDPERAFADAPERGKVDSFPSVLRRG